MHFRLMRNEAEWQAYCDELNSHKVLQGVHVLHPGAYPCMVHTTFGPSWNGPETWDHHFLYREDARALLVDLVLAT